uniref:Uncharacterized protein n=1 Tax=Oryza glumipatula TaxID=40148 RepID=A0A0D9Z7U0_9ORYZ
MGGAGVQARELARRAYWRPAPPTRSGVWVLEDYSDPRSSWRLRWKIDYSCGAAGVLGGPDAAVVEVLPDGIDGGEEILLQLGCEEVVYVQRSARGVAQPQDIAAGSWTPPTGVYAERIATRDFRMRIGDPSAPKDQKLIEDWSEKVLLKLQNLKPGNWLPEGL